MIKIISLAPQNSERPNKYNQPVKNPVGQTDIKINDPLIVPSGIPTYKLINGKLHENGNTIDAYCYGQYKVTKTIYSQSKKITYLEITAGNDSLIINSSDAIKYLGPIGINPLEYNLNFRVGDSVVIPVNTKMYQKGKDNRFVEVDNRTNTLHYNGKAKIKELITRTKDGRLTSIEGLKQGQSAMNIYAVVDIYGDNKLTRLFHLNDLIKFIPKDITKNDKDNYVEYQNVNDKSNLQIAPSIKVINYYVAHKNASILTIRWFDDQNEVHYARLDSTYLFGRTFKENSKFKVTNYEYNNKGNLNYVILSVNDQSFGISVNEIKKSALAYANPYVKQHHKSYHK